MGCFSEKSYENGRSTSVKKLALTSARTVIELHGLESTSSIQSQRNYWGTPGRCIVFVIAATSIASLIADLYGVCSMYLFTSCVFMPATVLLLAFVAIDRFCGNGLLWRAVWIGLVGGLIATVVYDVFRLPFVFSKEWGTDFIIPPMKLFKVFPRFGAMLLGQPIEQSTYSLTTQIIGWLYHFSNGATFGMMYVAIIGDGTRRHWAWAVLFALALELGMLFTPYPTVFNIPLTTRFVVVTVAAHAFFGVGLGLTVCSLAKNRKLFSRLNDYGYSQKTKG